MQQLRIIYMGTPEFAVPGLEILVKNGFNVVAVITTPDKPQGRGLQLGESAVKLAALKLNIPVLQPVKLKDESFINELKSYKADLQIVVAFRMLPEMVWNMPRLGTFNLHASLLPQYRGAAPINWAIINGETQTGITTFFLKHEIDTGDLILQESEPIHYNDTAGTLYERLMHKGADLILRTVQLIDHNSKFNPIPQNSNQILKTAPKIFKEHCQINFNQSAKHVYDFVRGLNPFPSAYCYLNNTYTKVHEVQIIESTIQSPFETDGKSFVLIKCNEGSISLINIQPEGKRKMNIKEYLAGNKVEGIR
ncbi:MAG: methionyl-tRNA formyltransferase [Bacteroidota bacterium]|nr:methionyl-tRNA formyltransferase [Bacteroidota bacterium]